MLVQRTTCHLGPGIYSVRTITSLLRPSRAQQDFGSTGAPNGYLSEAMATRSWKRNQYNWGLLNGYWKSLLVQGRR